MYAIKKQDLLDILSQVTAKNGYAVHHIKEVKSVWNDLVHQNKSTRFQIFGSSCYILAALGAPVYLKDWIVLAQPNLVTQGLICIIV